MALRLLGEERRNADFQYLQQLLNWAAFVSPRPHLLEQNKKLTDAVGYLHPPRYLHPVLTATGGERVIRCACYPRVFGACGVCSLLCM